MNSTVYEDIKNVILGLSELVNSFENKKILITGHQGFLGSNFTAFFSVLNHEVLKQKAHVICMDNKIVDLEDQTKSFSNEFTLIQGSEIKDLPTNKFDYIIHCAGIASPTFYRRYPLETIEVNAIGYWKMLNEIDTTNIKGFLYFSTSEIYGDPDKNNIPTNEEYRGNVSSTGPRACYDESKRLGETISITFFQQRNYPIKIVRPFNVYGPYMRLNDKRVIPDFVKFAFAYNEIKLFSDGKPTRAFCYISDALEGFLRALLIGKAAHPYNIGNDSEEISMKQLANYISEIIGNIPVILSKSSDKDYLVDNPQRRCPNIKRAKTELNYYPKVNTKEGLKRIINWYKQTYSDNR